MRRGEIERTFEYVTAAGETAEMLFNFAFSYTPGTRRSHPGGHWNRSIGSWDPPDDPEWELLDVTRRTPDGKWVRVTETDWIWDAWVQPMWEALGVADFEEALGES